MKEKQSEGRTSARDRSAVEYEVISRWVKMLRETTDMSQGQLSREIGRERAYINRIESQTRLPDIATFLKIVKMCGADPAETVAKIVEQIEKENQKRGGKH